MLTPIIVPLLAVSGNDGIPSPPSSGAAPAPEKTVDWTPQRPEFEAMARQLLEGTNPFVGRGNLDDLYARLASASVTAEESRSIRREVARHHLRLGDTLKAISMLDEVIAEMGGVDSPLMRRDPEVLLGRGLAYLRLAEVENCISRHNRDCCIFPLQGGGIHAVDEPARKAKEDYLTYLNLTAARESGAILMPKYYHAAWMLNVACMALDEFPDGVPVLYRVADRPHASAQSERVGRYVDVAGSLGVDVFDHAGGVIADDFDGDGWLDIVTSTCAVDGPMKAWRNRGDGSFEFVADQWRLDDQLGGLNIFSVDYNNDGRLDIFVARGAWMFVDGRMRKSLLRQNTDGTFTDVTREAGLGGMVAPSQAVVWADFDNDGWLDLYVAHESRQETGKPDQVYPSYLFHNNRDGTFTDVAASAGVTNDRYGKGVAAGDYDNDGDMDLYVSNIGLNRLYRNEGGMRFVDVAPALGVTEPSRRSFVPWFFDFDNDGDLDLWVCAYDATVNDIILSANGQMNRGHTPCLYLNDGEGHFRNVAREAGVARVWLPMGANFGDFNNDGWLDVYLGTGDPAYETLTPNVALLNEGGQRFVDVTREAGLGHLQKGHGVAFADFDHDGDQDIYHQLGGFFPGDAFRNALFENPGHGARFLTVELEGRRTNRMAIGARLMVEFETPTGVRQLHRAPGCVSSFGGSPRRQEIGLADATRIVRMEVWWPASETRQVLTDVPLDSFVRIVEGEAGIARLERAHVPLRTSP